MAAEEQTHKNPLYYTRRGEEVKGPYPHGQVSRYILLGRIHLDDELSGDGQGWRKVTDFPELIPEVLHLDLSLPENQEKLEAARRWADERRLRGEGEAAPEERRTPEAEEKLDYRKRREHALELPKATPRGMLLLLLTVVVVAVVVLLATLWTPPPVAIVPSCDAPPAAGVVWDNCRISGLVLNGQDLSGASLRNAQLDKLQASGAIFERARMDYCQLIGADLRQARFASASLVGTALREADLRGADLRGADLTYADLTDANLEGAQLEGARLGDAYWIDGSLCAKGSVGRCDEPPGGR